MFYLINEEIMDLQRKTNEYWKEVRWFDEYVTEINFCQAVFRGTLGFREEISIHAKYFALEFTDILLIFPNAALSPSSCVCCTSQTGIFSAELQSVCWRETWKKKCSWLLCARTHTHTHTKKQYKSEKLHACWNFKFSKFTFCIQV